MPFTLTMPKLSPTMEEGVISKWRKKENEFVSSGEVILEIATDKATIEFTALDEGFLKKILIPEGKKALINQPIAIFTVEKNESIEGYEPKGIRPEMAKESSSFPEKDSAALLDTQITSSSARKEWGFAPSPALTNYVFEESSSKPLASPLAKKLADEKSLDLTTIKGSGPGGRITSEDLSHALPQSLVSFGKKAFPTLLPGTYEEKELTPLRKAIGKRLQASKSSIPHFYVTIKIDASPMVKLREELKFLKFSQITFNDMIIRASAIGLKAHKEINVGYNSIDQKSVHFKTIDISIAVPVEGGLITPIIRHADYKNLADVSIEMRALAEKARNGQLKEEEYIGGSFCISNLGMYGISEFIAVINPPQGAILAVGGILDEAIVKNGSVVAGKTLNLTLSCDHRVIDGKDAATFLKTIKELLENPVSLTI